MSLVGSNPAHLTPVHADAARSTHSVLLLACFAGPLAPASPLHLAPPPHAPPPSPTHPQVCEDSHGFFCSVTDLAIVPEWAGAGHGSREEEEVAAALAALGSVALEAAAKGPLIVHIKVRACRGCWQERTPCALLGRLCPVHCVRAGNEVSIAIQTVPVECYPEMCVWPAR